MVKFIKKLFLFIMCCASVSASELSKSEGSGSSSGEFIGTARTVSANSLHSSLSSDSATSEGSIEFVEDATAINTERKRKQIIRLLFHDRIMQGTQTHPPSTTSTPTTSTDTATPASTASTATTTTTATILADSVTPPPTTATSTTPTSTTVRAATTEALAAPASTASTTATTTATTTMTTTTNAVSTPTTTTPQNELVGGSTFEEVTAGDAVFYTTADKQQRDPSTMQVARRNFALSIASFGSQAALSAWKAKEDTYMRLFGCASTVIPQMQSGDFSIKPRSQKTKRYQVERTVEELLKNPTDNLSKLFIVAAFIRENPQMCVNTKTRNDLAAHLKEVAQTTTNAAQMIHAEEPTTTTQHDTPPPSQTSKDIKSN